MAESLIVRTKRDVQWLFADNGAAHTYTPSKEPGDGTYNVPDYTIVHVTDRGVIGAIPDIRIGDEQVMTGGFSVYLRDFGDTANSYASFVELCHRYVGRYVENNWVSTMGANSDVFTITISCTVDGSPFGEADRTITFPFCVLRGNVAEGDPSKVACTFTSYAVRPTLS